MAENLKRQLEEEEEEHKVVFAQKDAQQTTLVAENEGLVEASITLAKSVRSLGRRISFFKKRESRLIRDVERLNHRVDRLRVRRRLVRSLVRFFRR